MAAILEAIETKSNEKSLYLASSISQNKLAWPSEDRRLFFIQFIKENPRSTSALERGTVRLARKIMWRSGYLSERLEIHAAFDAVERKLSPLLSCKNISYHAIR